MGRGSSRVWAGVDRSVGSVESRSEGSGCCFVLCRECGRGVAGVGRG